jgi:UDP-N-acetyl-D-glucosamine dehydrogenase
VFSLERVSSGRVLEDLARYAKLVGGLSDPGEERGIELYGAFLDAEIWGMGSAEAAEMAKLVETTYRDVNIALANEFAQVADGAGLDIDRIIQAANSQPFSHVHRPAIAVGGHCIPVYPRFFLDGHPTARLPAVARAVNEAMPGYAVDLLGDIAGRRVLVLGVAYRGGVKETAFSGVQALRDELETRGGIALFADPLYTADELCGLGSTPWEGEAVDEAVVQADHRKYAALAPEDVGGAVSVVDGRGILDRERFRAAGVKISGIGRPAAALNERAPHQPWSCLSPSPADPGAAGTPADGTRSHRARGPAGP